MDPNTLLQELLKQKDKLLYSEYDSSESHEEVAKLIQEGIILAEMVESLDLWLSGGGFLPKKWKVNKWSPDSVRRR